MGRALSIALSLLFLVASTAAEARVTKNKKHKVSKARHAAPRPVAAVTRTGLPNVQARSSLVVDLSTGEELFAKNADEVRPIASISKLVAMLVVLEQAASVLATVRRDGIELKGGAWSIEEEETFKAPIRRQYEEQGHPYFATARLWDDGIIDPADTRRVLALGLAVSRNAPVEDTKFGLFRM